MGGERDVIVVGLGVAGIVVDLVHRRGHQPAGLGQHVEQVAGRLDERPAGDVEPCGRFDDDDGAALRGEAERFDAGQLRHSVRPGAGCVDQHRRGDRARGRFDLPIASDPANRANRRARPDLAAGGAELPNVALQERGAVELEAAFVEHGFDHHVRIEDRAQPQQLLAPVHRPHGGAEPRHVGGELRQRAGQFGIGDEEGAGVRASGASAKPGGGSRKKARL
jgi:hypothetical protein